MSCEVSLVRCTDYDIAHVRAALCRLLEPLGGLGWVAPHMKIAALRSQRAADRAGRRGYYRRQSRRSV